MRRRIIPKSISWQEQTAKPTRPKHLESDLQKTCVRWFRYTYPKYQKLLFAVPNGGFRHASTAKVLIGEGVVAGVSDLILLVPNRVFHGLCLEMKIKPNKQTELQKEWEILVRNAGYCYSVAYSVEEFMDIINSYLEKV